MPDASIPSPEFVRLVRSALVHFYDYAYLQNHPLGLMLDVHGKLDRMTKAQQVRRVLLECIETLRPDVQNHKRADAARAHAILTYRYVDGLSMQEIAGELALSRQQVYREHEKGIEAVASLLWDMVRVNAKSDLLTGHIQETGNERLRIAQAEVDRLRQAVHTEFLNLQEVLEGVLKLLAPLAQQAGVQIRMSSPDTWPLIATDRVLARQAFLNLLTYALDTVQGDLTVAASYSRGGLLIDIHESPRSTEAQPISSSAPRRAGVGLEVARRLIEAQGGYLEAERREGRWQAQIMLPTASNKPTILIIDDNADMVALFQRYLAGYKVSIVGATDGNQALKLAAESRPQVITLDVMMPHQDGWDILQRLKDSPDTKQIPVIVCSVLDEPQLALSSGASDYITKPVSQASLLEVLQRWLGPLQALA